MSDSVKGIIFDIQKFALHDGPGIRTVIFIKGCPLSCTWCCNPESQNPKPQLAYLAEKCTFCGSCESVCPNDVHAIDGSHHTVQFDLCKTNGRCIDNCPAHALKIYGWETDTGTIVKEINKDKAYFNKSGGGLTLSGGEAMMQFDFAMSLLSKAKESGIHTCLETCGFAKKEQFKKILTVTDLFLYDYKITNPDLHKKHTGVTLDTILKNLAFLNSRNASIILRCPIIPSINDIDEHFEGIARIANQHQNIKEIHLMPYHEYGHKKYKELGMPDPQISTHKILDKDINQWIHQLKSLGCKNVKRG